MKLIIFLFALSFSSLSVQADDCNCADLGKLPKIVPVEQNEVLSDVTLPHPYQKLYMTVSVMSDLKMYSQNVFVNGKAIEQKHTEVTLNADGNLYAVALFNGYFNGPGTGRVSILVTNEKCETEIEDVFEIVLSKKSVSRSLDLLYKISPKATLFAQMKEQFEKLEALKIDFSDVAGYHHLQCEYSVEQKKKPKTYFAAVSDADKANELNLVIVTVSKSGDHMANDKPTEELKMIATAFSYYVTAPWMSKKEEHVVDWGHVNGNTYSLKKTAQGLIVRTVNTVNKDNSSYCKIL